MMLRSTPLQKQLSLTFASVGIGAVVLTAAALTFQMRASRRDATLRRLNEAASEVCAATDAYIQLHAAGLQVLADALSIQGTRDGLLAHASLSDQLERFHRSHQGFLVVQAIDAQGRVRGTAHGTLTEWPHPSSAPVSVSDRPYFRVPMATHAPFVSDVFRGRDYGSENILALSTPIIGEAGVPLGVIEGTVDLSQLGHFRDAYRSLDGSAVLITDRRAQVIYSSTGAPVVGSVAPQTITEPLGQRSLSAACQTAAGWRVSLQLPMRTVERDDWAQYAVAMLSALCVTLVVLSVAGTLARRLSAPLHALSSAAEQSDDDISGPRTRFFDSAADTAHSAPREVLVLAAQLDALSDRVAGRERELREALADTESELHTMFQAMRDVVFVFDANGTYLRVVPTAPDLLYTPANDMLGHRVTEVLPPATAAAVLAVIQGVLGTGEPREFDYELRVARGEVTLSAMVSRLTADTVLWVARDVTERVRDKAALAESEASHRQLIETTSDVIQRTNRHGDFTFVNAAAMQLIGTPPDELLGKSWSTLVVDTDRERVGGFYAAQLRDRIPVTYLEFAALRANGDTLWVGQTTQLLLDRGEVVGLQSVTRDMSARREVDRMKDEFVSVVSHELRTPLTAIRGALGLMSIDPSNGGSRHHGQMLRVAIQNTDRLVRLTDGILEIERQTAGYASLVRRECCVRSLIQEAAESLSLLAYARDMDVTIADADATVQADPDRVVQVLVNLLGNAIKFSPTGSTIFVSTHITEDTVEVRVRDEGRGIPASDLERVFERFYKVASQESRGSSGTGLGLSISRGIARQHGGDLIAERGAGSGNAAGSVFVLTLPMHVVADAGYMSALGL